MSGLSSLCAPNATGKGKRLIIFHIRPKDGFVDGGLLFFEPKKGSTDYHDEMKGNLFVDWLTDVISLLKQVHFSNGQCALPFGKTRTITLCWKKKDITKWLKDEGEQDTYTTRTSWKSSNHDIINMWLTAWRIYQLKRYDITTYTTVLLRTKPDWTRMIINQTICEKNNSTFKLPDVQTITGDITCDESDDDFGSTD